MEHIISLFVRSIFVDNMIFAFFLGMVLTPPDPMSQMLMAGPLVLLYELSIWGVRLKEICTGEGAKKDSGESK